MSTVILDTITGKSTATTVTIGSTPVVSASANSMTIRGEGSNQTSIQQGLAKSEVQFNGSTNAINGSSNIASMTDHTTGDYSVTFTNNMADTNYCATTDTVSESGEGDPRDTSVNLTRTFSSSTYGLLSKYNAGTANDRTKMFSAVHGDLS